MRIPGNMIRKIVLEMSEVCHEAGSKMPDEDIILNDQGILLITHLLASKFLLEIGTLDVNQDGGPLRYSQSI